MSELDRMVAGVRCRDVLADLSDYLDGTLPAERLERIEAHLRGCDNCERFGGRFAGVVHTLRTKLESPEPLEPEVERRLKDRLRRARADGR